MTQKLESGNNQQESNNFPPLGNDTEDGVLRFMTLRKRRVGDIKFSLLIDKPNVLMYISKYEC